MRIAPFQLERYFAKYEFKARYLLSASDCEGLAMQELLEMASPDSRALWQRLSLGYTESQGHPLLRAEIARTYERVSAERILTAAPEEAILIAMLALLQPGDHVIATAPAYQSLHEAARLAGGSLTPWMLTPQGDGWGLDLEAFEPAITPQTRLLVINFPHNPTGHTLALAELQEIVEIARRHGLYIFSDEMYRLLEWEAGARLPPVCDLYEKGISLSGLSKSFALAGLRLGWLAAQEAGLVERWLQIKDYTTICSSAPSEILGIIALQNAGRILKRNLKLMQQNLALAEQFFAGQPELFAWMAPKAGSIAFPEWRGAGTVEQFCQQVLEAVDVMIVPGSLFDYPGGHFRIGLGRRNFGEALRRVQEYLGAGQQPARK